MYEYCKSHLGPHSTGWCTVDDDRRVPLKAKSLAEAMHYCIEQGWPVYPDRNMSRKWNVYGELI
jgi:hypothetical protein